MKSQPLCSRSRALALHWPQGRARPRPQHEPAAQARRGARRRLEKVDGAAMAEGEGLLSVDYEVSGKVQGVFFRKYTQVRGGAGSRVLLLPAGVSGALCQPCRGCGGSRGGAEPPPGCVPAALLSVAVVSQRCWRPVPRYVSMTGKCISARVLSCEGT